MIMKYESDLRNISFGKRVLTIITAAVFGFVSAGEIKRNLGLDYTRRYRKDKPYSTPMPEAIMPGNPIKMPWYSDENVSTSGKSMR